MLDEYRDLCYSAASIIPDWENMTKNDLCREYVRNKGNSRLENAYISAILYRYWNLISKYYYMSSNCATPEECYGWLVDSVFCCVNLASWENPESSIHNDPNGPDKVINRCMKCARLTYYQFINRKKRKDDFGLLSLEEMREMFGSAFNEPQDYEHEMNVSKLIIYDYILEEFVKKNYFVCFLVYFIISGNVFDHTYESNSNYWSEFNLRKICKIMNNVTEEDLLNFSTELKLNIDDVKKAFDYIKAIPAANMRKKIQQTLESMKHSSFIISLLGDNHVN